MGSGIITIDPEYGRGGFQTTEFHKYIFLNSNGRRVVQCFCKPMELEDNYESVLVRAKSHWLISDIARSIACTVLQPGKNVHQIEVLCRGIVLNPHSTVREVYLQIWKSQDESMPLRFRVKTLNCERSNNEKVVEE